MPVVQSSILSWQKIPENLCAEPIVSTQLITRNSESCMPIGQNPYPWCQHYPLYFLSFLVIIPHYWWVTAWPKSQYPYGWQWRILSKCLTITLLVIIAYDSPVLAIYTSYLLPFDNLTWQRNIAFLQGKSWKISYKWWIFHSQISLPEGKHSYENHS